MPKIIQINMPKTTKQIHVLWSFVCKKLSITILFYNPKKAVSSFSDIFFKKIFEIKKNENLLLISFFKHHNHSKVWRSNGTDQFVSLLILLIRHTLNFVCAFFGVSCGVYQKGFVHTHSCVKFLKMLTKHQSILQSENFVEQFKFIIF